MKNKNNTEHYTQEEQAEYLRYAIGKADADDIAAITVTLPFDYLKRLSEVIRKISKGKRGTI